jgi:hypothetical protein
LILINKYDNVLIGFGSAFILKVGSGSAKSERGLETLGLDPLLVLKSIFQP